LKILILACYQGYFLKIINFVKGVSDLGFSKEDFIESDQKRLIREIMNIWTEMKLSQRSMTLRGFVVCYFRALVSF
jgi:hypothetical protein